MNNQKSVNKTKKRKYITSKTALILSIIIVSASIYLFINQRQNTPTNTKPIVFIYASPESQGLENETLIHLQETVQGFVDSEEIVGAELVIIKNKNIILHEAFGWKDKENYTPLEKNTVYNLRSMTKPIIGTAIQQLIDQNQLSLETKISEYIPGFNNEASENITVEQLLTHHSGLPLSTMTSLDDFDTLQSLVNATGVNGPQFTPGTKFWYSDAGSEVLGALIEEVSGMTLDEYVSKEVLIPLGMNSTFYYYNETLNEPRAAQIADLYIGSIGQWVKYWSPGESFYRFAMGSQGLYGTTLDYARFLTMWLDQGKVGETQFLSTEAIERTLTPFSKMSSLGSDMPFPTGYYKLEANYGQMSIIWTDTDSETSVKVIGHTGSDGTYAWAWPELDMIVLYFTQSRGSTTGLKLEAKIDELLIHPEITELNNNARKKYEKYLGGYIANFGPFRNTEITVTVQNGELAVDIPNQLVFNLEGDEPIWRFKLMPEVSISFISEGDAVSAMVFNQSGMIFELPKGTAITEEIYPTDMEKYLGEYETEDPNITMSVVIHEGMLALIIPGQPIELDLYPPDDNGLWVMKLNPTVGISFIEKDGKIDSLILKLPDGTTYTRNRID
jgi:CubicO group peptidase (beta-lactamase class C family)